MRNLLVLISSFILNAAIAQSPLAKTKWALKDRELRAELNSEKIDTEEWYKRIRIEAGSLGSSLQAWFVSKSKIAKASQTEKRLDIIQGFSAFIPNEFQIIKENGNRFIQILLINNSDTSVPILRADATILGLSCFVKAGNEWILLRGGTIVSCGNSFFTDSLPKKSLMTIQLDNVDHGDGNIKIPFKVKFLLDDQVIESNEVTIKLHLNQIKRLKEENEILKQTQKRTVS
jgi:hypothetical protein